MPTINGREWQHATMGLFLAPLVAGAPAAAIKPTTKFKEISYKDAAEKKHVHDAQGEVCSYTIDPRKPDGKLVYLLSAWDEIRSALSSVALSLQCGIGQLEMLGTVIYGVNTVHTRTDVVKFMFQDEGTDSKDDQEALVQELPLFVIDVKRAVDTQGAQFMAYFPPV